MKKILKICLLVFILISSLNAKDIYSQENITKHLETLFTKEIRYEGHNKTMRYNPFSNKIRVYYEFSDLIKNQKEKVEILKEEIKKFEKITNLEIELKEGKPDITLTEEKGLLKTIYNSKDSIFEQHIYFGFSSREEMFEKIKKGYWYKQFILGENPNMYQRIVDYMQRQREITIGKKSTQRLTYKNVKIEINKKYETKGKIDLFIPKHFRLLEINEYRNKNFKKLMDKELYFSLLSGRGRWNSSKYIQPSIFNNRNDDFSKEEISEFDWILLDEFYNNKDLRVRHFYKTQVIPTLTQSIHKRLKKSE